MKYQIITYLLILFLGFQTVCGQSKENISIGSAFKIYSNILNEERTCFISLPDSYKEHSEFKDYPVLILLDGYTYFKTTVGIVHFMSSSRNRNNIIPEMIIVAIENVNRERDFTVTKLKTKRANSMGGGRNFLSFIEKELIPFVDKIYSTEANRILVGHSLGGLLAVNSYIDENSLFDDYLSIDPSIWWDDKTMLEKVNSIPQSSFNKKLYIATANQGEANQERNKKRHVALFNLIKKRHKIPRNIKLEYFKSENHRSVPLIAIYQGLRYLFSD